MLLLEAIGYAALLVAALVVVVYWGTSGSETSPLAEASPADGSRNDDAFLRLLRGGDDAPEDEASADVSMEKAPRNEAEAEPLACASNGAPEEPIMRDAPLTEAALCADEPVPRQTPPPPPLRFFYRDQLGKVSIAKVSGWSELSDVIVGQCEEAKAERTFHKKLIVRWIDGSDGNLERPYG